MQPNAKSSVPSARKLIGVNSIQLVALIDTLSVSIATGIYKIYSRNSPRNPIKIIIMARDLKSRTGFSQVADPGINVMKHL